MQSEFLQVRLEHMLQRLRALQDASLTGRPIQLLPHLYVSGAVEANSLHILRHLGISRILNATEDLLLPEESAGFRSRAPSFFAIPHLGPALCGDHSQLFFDLLHHISRCSDCSHTANYISFFCSTPTGVSPLSPVSRLPRCCPQRSMTDWIFHWNYDAILTIEITI